MRFPFWKKKQDKLPPHKPEHRLIEAFEVKGVKYFQFDCTIGNMPYQRGLEALVAYERVRMRCTREYLEQHTKAIHALLREKKIDVFKINQLNQNLTDRINWVVETDTLYELASIVYFDATESPYSYNHDYNKKKIEQWKKHSAELKDFFLQKPLVSLLPFLEQSKENFQVYSMVTEELKKEQMRLIQEILSTRG